MRLQKNRYIPYGLVIAILLVAGIYGSVTIFHTKTKTPSITKTSSKAVAVAPTPVQTQKPLAPVVTMPVSKILLSDPLSGQDRIVTNEYTHWSPNSSCPYKSSIWDMTSGTLLVHNGVGYSGVPTAEKTSVCNSTVANNSATFRLNTKNYSFSNIDVSFDYMIMKHATANPVSSFDGLHVWVGYQNEYALYSASVFRWDNIVAIKKKVPLAQAQCSNPANKGCYYDIVKEDTKPVVMTTAVWHHADIQYSANTAQTVSIKEIVDGSTLLTAQDSSLHGKPYTVGAVGIRGDNTEFSFKNFTVSKL